MKILEASTAIALALGLGMATATVPAFAAGEQAGAKAETTAETGTAAAGTEGAAAGTEGAAAGTEAQPGMEGGDEYVTSEQARTDAERQFDEIGRGEEFLSEEHMGTAFPEAGQAGQDMFAQIDEDGDGQISREEWVSWREQGFAEATQGSQGQMSAQDYETWQRSPGELGGGEAGAGEQGMTTPTDQGTGTSQ